MSLGCLCQEEGGAGHDQDQGQIGLHIDGAVVQICLGTPYSLIQYAVNLLSICHFVVCLPL